MNRCFVFFFLALAASAASKEPQVLPAELSSYQLDPAPAPSGPLLRKGDKLAICGDSITEQKRYSVIMESYLTACMPELDVTCRQFGWSGEQAGGFLNRMKRDVLRFKPSIATVCYGMNDFRYVPFDEKIAEKFRRNETAIVKGFQASGTRVVLGSSGIIDSVPDWVKSASGTKQELNHALSRFRNITLQVATEQKAAFADVYQPMLLANHQAQKLHGPEFKVAGKDGVHPGWAGQVVMAYAFLKSFGLDGELGTITFDARNGGARASGGHEIVSAKDGTLTIKSHRLPFSPGPGALDNDDSIAAGLALVPFNDELNRFTLKIVSPTADDYDVTWGEVTRTYRGSDLKQGINLAKDFPNHPLVPAFQKVWRAVAAKQEYETRQIKMLAHGPEGAADLEGTFALTEKARAKFAKKVASSIQPTEHSITIVPRQD